MYYTAAYIRLSREDGDKEESDSVANQRKLLQDYIGRTEGLVYAGEYVDDGFSGTDFCRPAFQDMLRDIRNGTITCVAVKDLSRFGRDYIDAGAYLERYFPKLGVRFISVAEGIDSLYREYDMMLPIRNIFNEQYARDISQKIQAAIRIRQESGDFIGAFACYGYRKSGAVKGRLVVDPYAAGVVRRIFSLYLQGVGKREIADILNREGILCPAEYKRALGEAYFNPNCRGTGSCWTYSAVNGILHREMYLGNMVQGTKHQRLREKQKAVAPEQWIRVEQTHEPIIDRQTWERTQRLLRGKSGKPAAGSGKNLFAGLAKCGDCGRSMVKNTWRLADGSCTGALYCGTYKRHGRTSCTPHALPQEVLEKVVLQDLNHLIAQIDNLREWVYGRCFPPGEGHAEAGRKHGIRTEYHRIRRLKQAVYEDYREGLVTKEEYGAYLADYRKREAVLQQQLYAAEQEGSPVEGTESPWLRQFLESGRIRQLDRATVTEMIGEIRVYEGKRIRICYNFQDCIF